MNCTTFRANIPGYTLNTSNYDAKARFLHLTAQTSKCPRRFWERDPEILRTCLMCPCRAFVFSFFFAGNVWSLKTQISPTIENPIIWQSITKKNIRKLLGRAKINVCAKFQGLSKTACILDSEGIWGYMREPACTCTGMSVSLTFSAGCALG